MKNLTKEEKDLPVTYESLMEILKEMSDHIVEVNNVRDKETVEIFQTITEKMVEIIDTLEYNRNRDLHYFIGRIAANEFIDKDVLLKDYIEWCTEFDKLNKKSEEANNEQ